MLKKSLISITVISLSLLSISSTASGDNLKTRATIKNIKNNVELKYASSLWRTARLNQLVMPGTLIRTGTLSQTELLYADGTVTRIGSRTSLTVLNKDAREIRINSGNLWFKVTKKSYGLKIRTPFAVAAITGTEGGVKVELEEEKETTSKSKSEINVTVTGETINLSNDKKDKNTQEANVTVAVAEGTVATTIGNKTYTVGAGDKVSFSTSSPEKAEFKNIGVEKVKSLFESSKPVPSTSTTTTASSIANDVTSGISMAKMMALKSNMTLVQKMAEAYALDEGSYPRDVNVLIEDAQKKKYFKEFSNAFTNRKGINNTIMNYSSFKKSNGGGFVLYEASDCSGDNCSTYKIYSSSANGSILKVNGNEYYLSNR